MHSEQINEIAKAICKAQESMTFAKKDGYNPHFKSNFADLASVISALKEPFAKAELSYTQIVSDDHLVTMLMHSSGQWIKSKLKIMVTKNDAQGFGSGLTYARRYALSAIAGIAQDDDDANGACEPVNTPQAQQQTPQKPTVSSANSHQKTEFLKAMGALKRQLGDKLYADRLGLAGFESAEDVTPQRYREVYDAVERG